jgi:hypothetical protein
MGASKYLIVTAAGEKIECRTTQLKFERDVVYALNGDQPVAVVPRFLSVQRLEDEA